MAEPTPFKPHFEELDEECPDCGSAPITGHFSYLGKFRDPQAERLRLMAAGGVDVRVFGDILCALIDWDCSKEACRKAKTYNESPATRLAKRANP